MKKKSVPPITMSVRGGNDFFSGNPAASTTEHDRRVLRAPRLDLIRTGNSEENQLTFKQRNEGTHKFTGLVYCGQQMYAKNKAFAHFSHPKVVLWTT